jgi:hypothetical protein
MAKGTNQPGDALFAGEPAAFVERGGLGRLLRRVGEPRRTVAVPDAVHDHHAVWGVALPRELAALARAVAAVDVEWVGRWRPAFPAAFALPARPNQNLFERVVVADQRDRRGTAIVEMLAGAVSIGDLRAGPRLLVGAHDAALLDAAPVWSWDRGARVLGGPVARDLGSLAWAEGIAVARREKILTEEAARALAGRVAAGGRPARRAPTEVALAQNRWLLHLLRDGDAIGAAAAFAGVRRPALGAATLARAPLAVPAALDALFRAWLIADRAEPLAAHLVACAGSRSRLVRDAARLVDELSRGRRKLGRLRDVARARDQLRAALGRR